MDETISHALSSAKRSTVERDQGTHHAGKGNQRDFGLKTRMYVGRKDDVVLSVRTSVANAGDVPNRHQGEDQRISVHWGDAANAALIKPTCE